MSNIFLERRKLLSRSAKKYESPLVINYSPDTSSGSTKNVQLLRNSNIVRTTVNGAVVKNGSTYPMIGGENYTVEYFFRDPLECGYENLFRLNQDITEISIPEGTKEINSAFAIAASKVTKVYLPESITYLAKDSFTQTRAVFNDGDLYLPNIERLECFSSGSVMNSLTLGTITTLGNSSNYQGAFISQWTLDTLDLPETVTTMRDGCIDRCTIKTIIIRATTPPELPDSGKDPFFQSNIIARTKIYVPAASLNLYKTTPGWSYYASVMYPLESLYVTFYDYITNTGNGWNPAYLDLGVSAPSSSSETSTVTVELDVQYNPDAGVTPAPILGALVTESGTKCEGSCYTYGNFRIDFTGRTSGYQLMQDLTERHTYKYTYQVGGEITNLYKDGVIVSDPYIDSSTFSSTLNNNFILFGSYQPAWGRVDCTTNVIRIYGIKIWKDGELVMDGHPAISMEENHAGIFNYVDGITYFGGDRNLISAYNN